MTPDERYKKGLAMFAEANAASLARHLALNATPDAAASLMMTHADLIAYETDQLFARQARSQGFSMAYEYAWHLAACDEEQLKHWQMDALEREGENLGDRPAFSH